MKNITSVPKAGDRLYYSAGHKKPVEILVQCKKAIAESPKLGKIFAPLLDESSKNIIIFKNLDTGKIDSIIAKFNDGFNKFLFVDEQQDIDEGGF